ncbi:MAG: D-alanyl-D-alanine carboxypeptidase family protein [Nitrosomonadales bacterium]|nr:D-alanyl-D-alanine carboxypeptidase family protein [Nitrosomonadales bacterium]
MSYLDISYNDFIGVYAIGSTYHIPILKKQCPVPTTRSEIPYTPNPDGQTCSRSNACPVDPLTPIDPAVQPYENGFKDMINVTQATRDGAACIARAARAHRPRIIARLVSGYRPPAYQTHIREVYDKWQLLMNNNDAACADIKRQVKAEFKYHSKFSHQPGKTSPHSSGRAVDIGLSDYKDADTIAAGCAMFRTVPNDRSHFESPR